MHTETFDLVTFAQTMTRGFEDILTGASEGRLVMSRLLHFRVPNMELSPPWALLELWPVGVIMTGRSYGQPELWPVGVMASRKPQVVGSRHCPSSPGHAPDHFCRTPHVVGSRRPLYVQWVTSCGWLGGPVVPSLGTVLTTRNMSSVPGVQWQFMVLLSPDLHWHSGLHWHTGGVHDHTPCAEEGVDVPSWSLVVSFSGFGTTESH